MNFRLNQRSVDNNAGHRCYLVMGSTPIEIGRLLDREPSSPAIACSLEDFILNI